MTADPTTPCRESSLSEEARQWVEFCERLADAGRRVHELADGERSPAQRNEINQALLWSLSMGALHVSEMDPDYPDWLPHLNSTYLNPCSSSDFGYFITRIRGSGAYRITGTRGTVNRLDLAIMDGFMGPTVTNVDFDDLEIAPDGRFELVLSRRRPEGHTGNWRPLPPEIEDVCLTMRQVFYDWAEERDGVLAIQRIDKPIDQPWRRNSIAQRLAQVPAYLENKLTTLIGMLARQYPTDHQINRVETITSTLGGRGIIGQGYSAGEIVLSREEALIVEFEAPPDCPYWNTQLADNFYNALDFMFHQCSLNCHSAHVDEDGKIRIIVSEQDPGVPNWLDKGDYESNVLRFRWYKSAAPEMISTKVPFSKLREHLPPSTPIISPEQRQIQLRERIKLLQYRRRW